MSRVEIKTMATGTESNKAANLKGIIGIITREKGTFKHPGIHDNRQTREIVPLTQLAINEERIIPANVAKAQANVLYVGKRGIFLGAFCQRQYNEKY